MTSIKKECSYCHLAFDVNLDQPQSVCPFCGEELTYSIEEQKHFQIAKTPVLSGEIVETISNKNVLDLSVFTQKKRNSYSHLILWIISLIFVGLCVYFITNSTLNTAITADISNNSRPTNTQQIIQIHPPATPDKYKGRDYKEVVMYFENAGFTNVIPYPLSDKHIDIFATNINKVDSITINGNIDYDTSTTYPSNAKVVISYHSWAKDKK